MANPSISTVTILLLFNTLLVILWKELVELLVVVIVLVLFLTGLKDITLERMRQPEREMLLLKELKQATNKY